MNSRNRAFTLIEMLVVISIIVLLASLLTPTLGSALHQARTTASMSNLRQLAQANLLYALDHHGRYAPAQDRNNLTRWHGRRANLQAPFEVTEGYLSPYLGQSRAITRCPLLLHTLRGSASWEDGSGGYGYNAAYIGGTPRDPFTPATTAVVANPSRTVMFTTTAFAVREGLQEYPFAEPYRWVDPNGNLHGLLQPSVHFRGSRGRAPVAWCDGSVSLMAPSPLSGPNVYGADNAEHHLGWFGPSEGNGYWNPENRNR